LGWSTLVGSSSKLVGWSGLAAAAGGALLIAYGVLCWVNLALLYGEVNAIGGVKVDSLWALEIVRDVGYLLFIGGLASLLDVWSVPGGLELGRPDRRLVGSVQPTARR
jgi:hypothetical protein